MSASDEGKFNRSVSSPGGRWVLVATILASSMAFIDSTALNVALPAIQRELGATGTELLWIVNAFLLFLAALLLVGGALGDRFGRKRIFSVGIGVFTLASLASGLSPSPGFLIAARAVQGVGGALMVPGSLSIITATFSASERGKAIGTWSAFTTVTTIIGPALGGVLADVGFWRGVFFINVPLGALAFYVTLRHMPESRDESIEGPLDVAGSALIVLGLAGLTYALITAGDRGLQQSLGSPLVLGALVGGLVAIAASIFVETRVKNPLLPLRLFKSQTFSGANLLTFFLYAALNGVTIFLPLNLVQAQGYRESLAGFAFLPFSVMLAALSRWAGGQVERTGPRLLLTVGPLLAGAGLFLLGLPGLTGGPSDYWTTFFPAALVFGVGMGLTVAPLTTTVMSAHEERMAGTASGINNAVSRTAGVLAVAVFGAIMLISFRGNLQSNVQGLNLPASAEQQLMSSAQDLGNTQPPEGLSQEQAVQVSTAIDRSFVDAFQLVTAICAGMAGLSALLGFLLIRNDVVTDE